jgi:hypothetical protein
MAANAGTAATANVTFSLAPMTMDRSIIDFSLPENKKMFSKATAKLSDTKFDLAPANLKYFLDKLGERALDYGWAAILNIPEDATAYNSPTKSLVTQYGSVTSQMIEDHVGTYITRDSRDHQDSYLMAKAIMASLTKAAYERVSLQKKSYTTSNGELIGAKLLKVIIAETHQDTNATTKHIREKLRDLHQYIVKVDSDIVKFNQHVNLLIEGLAAWGETTQDLLTDLFKAYKQASDNKFVEYIELKESDYEDGKSISPESLMILAQNKFQTKIENGTWNAPTKAEEKIIALEAQVKDLKKMKNKKANKDKKKNKSPDKNGDKKKKLDKPKWMTTPPEEGKPKEKVVNKKTYYWCLNHVAWVRHKPDQCKGKGYVPKKEEAKGEEDNESPAIRMSKALANNAVIDRD